MSETVKKIIQTYICTGCDIGESLDVEKLKKVPKESAEEVRQEEAKNPSVSLRQGRASVNPKRY